MNTQFVKLIDIMNLLHGKTGVVISDDIGILHAGLVIDYRFEYFNNLSNGVKTMWVDEQGMLNIYLMSEEETNTMFRKMLGNKED